MKKPIDMIGELPTDSLGAMIDGKRESFVEDNEIPVSVQDFRELFLNMFREIFQAREIIAVVVNLTAGGECSDDGVIRPNDPPNASGGSLPREFPLREGCEEVRNIGQVSVVKRKVVKVTIKDTREDGIVLFGWKGNTSTGNCNRGVGNLIPTFSISRPGGRIIRVKLHVGWKMNGPRLVMGTDLNGRAPKTSTEKNDNSQTRRN